MTHQIKIFDPYKVCQELPEVYPTFTLVQEPTDAAIDILPAQSDHSYQATLRPTVFVDTEPAMVSALTTYRQQLQARPNHIWAVSGHSKKFNWPMDTVDFFSNMVYVARVNSQLPPVSVDTKPWLATALFGGWSRHRGIKVKALIEKGLDQKCLITYLQRRPVINDAYDYKNQQLYFDYQTPLIRELDLPIFLERAHSGGFFSMSPLGNHHGDGWLSQLIPWKIYDSAMVSIVSETIDFVSLDTFLISEKISRPILVAQPFWVYGCSGFLRQLRDLGFRTYGQWWDETYDDINDNDRRALAVIDSFAEFAAKSPEDQLDICRQARSIALHNRNLMRNWQWHYQKLAQRLQSWVS